MTAQDEVNQIVAILRNAVASALGEKQNEKVSVEIRELSKVGGVFSIVAVFRIPPFLGGRSGKIYAALTKTEKGLEITNLKIDERGL